MKKSLVLLLVVGFLVACNLPIGKTSEATPETVTIVVTSTLEGGETPAAEAPVAESSEPPAQNVATISQYGVTMDVPVCLGAYPLVGQVDAILPESNPGPGDIWPAHRVLYFPNYPLADKFFDPIIRILPLEPYPVIDDTPSRQITELQSLLVEQPFVVSESIPFLPVFHAGQAFRLKIDYLEFQNGQGVRFLTEYAQYFVPMNNHDLFYTFQGLTSDNKYWISAIFPINHAVLQPTADDMSVPAGGLAFPDWNSPTFDADFANYYEQLGMILNGMSDDSFIPSITCLDSFIQSLQVGE